MRRARGVSSGVDPRPSAQVPPGRTWATTRKETRPAGSAGSPGAFGASWAPAPCGAPTPTGVDGTGAGGLAGVGACSSGAALAGEPASALARRFSGASRSPTCATAEDVPVAVGVWLGVDVLLAVALGVGITVAVLVAVALALAVALAVGLAAGLAVSVGLAVGLAVSVGLAGASVVLGVAVTVGVAVALALAVGVAVASVPNAGGSGSNSRTSRQPTLTDDRIVRICSTWILRVAANFAESVVLSVASTSAKVYSSCAVPVS